MSDQPTGATARLGAHERSNSLSDAAIAGLEKALNKRPEREELVERGILPSECLPSRMPHEDRWGRPPIRPPPARWT